MYKNIHIRKDLSNLKGHHKCPIIDRTFGRGYVTQEELAKILGYRLVTIIVQRNEGRGVKSFIYDPAQAFADREGLPYTPVVFNQYHEPKYLYAACDIRDYLERLSYANPELYRRACKNWYAQLYYYFDDPEEGVSHYI